MLELAFRSAEAMIATGEGKDRAKMNMPLHSENQRIIQSLQKASCVQIHLGLENHSSHLYRRRGWIGGL